MWEVIRRNRRRSWMLIGLMGVILLLLGWLIGSSLFANWGLGADVAGQVDYYRDTIVGTGGGNQDVRVPNFNVLSWMAEPSFWLNRGGLIGMGLAVLVWGGLTLFAFFEGDASLLRSMRAIPVEKEDAPQLWNVVEEMTIASGLGKMPKVYLIDDDVPNAFAVGREPSRASVAVTTGLLKRMNRDELQGVVAHEVAHICNLDVRFMTVAAIMLGTIVIISHVFLRSMFCGAGSRRSSSREGGGGGQIVMLVVAVLFAILAPIMARVLYMACSRRREYLADACGARFTRYPEGLASALEKLGKATTKKTKTVPETVAPMMTVNPLQSLSGGWFSTHPPLAKRVMVLRTMAGAGYGDYEEAYRRVFGERKHCLDESVLAKAERIGQRRASPAPMAKKSGMETAQEAIAMLDRAAGFLMIPCACGVRLKLPPGLSVDTFKCPRCGRSHAVPSANERKQDDKRTEKKMVYRRTGHGWESFRCRCGRTIQLSPGFQASSVRCSECQRTIGIESAKDADAG